MASCRRPDAIAAPEPTSTAVRSRSLLSLKARLADRQETRAGAAGRLLDAVDGALEYRLGDARLVASIK